MKLRSSLLLGLAAGLGAVGAAQAADLPMKAKVVEYVKVCSLYGAGFYYVPGSDTCIKLSGYMRIDLIVNSNADHTGNTGGPGGAQNRYTNGYTWRSRSDVDIDTRTATEYGVVRTFFDATFNWTSDSYTANGGSSIYSAIGTSPGPLNAGGGNVAYGAVGVYYAFIQFAGFTMGHAVSQFSAPWIAYPGNNFDGLVGGGGTITGVNQFTYTANLGTGLTLALSAQDQTAYYQAGVFNMGATTGYDPVANKPGANPFGGNNYAGTITPDFVGMFRAEQSWGMLQASVALHDNHAAYYNGLENGGHPDDKWGWAGQLALSLKNLPTGTGDAINVQGVYTNGATRYNIQEMGAQAGSTAIYDGIRSVGYGMAPDTVFGAGGQQELVSTWGVRGAFTHNWDPYWNTSLYGAYASISYTEGGKDLICNRTTGSFVRALNFMGSRCDPNYTIAQLGIVTRWTPVKNLTFSGELTYTMLDQNMSGTVDAGSAGIGKPSGVTYDLKDQNTTTFLFRAQREW